MWETCIGSLGWEDTLEEGAATHSTFLAWRIPIDRGAWQAIVHGVTKSMTQSFQEPPAPASPFCSESSIKNLFFTSGLDSRTISSNRVHQENVLGPIPPALCGRGEGTRTVAGSLGYTPLLGSGTETLCPTYLATAETDDKGELCVQPNWQQVSRG